MQKNFDKMLGVLAGTRVQVCKLLTATNAEAAREEFLEKPTMRRPDFEYGRLSLGDILERMTALTMSDLRLSEGLTGLEQEIVEMIYDYQVKQLTLLMDAIVIQETLKSQAYKPYGDFLMARNCYEESNRLLYGEPDYQTFRLLLKRRLDDIPVDQLSALEILRYRELRRKLLGDEPVAGTIFEPSEETLEKFRSILEEFYAGFFSHIPDQDTFTAEEASAILNEIIDEELAGATTFRAVVRDDATNVSVDQLERMIKLPKGRIFSREDVRALLIGHELGVHAYRSIAVEDAAIPAIVHGFPGRHGADEGLATCVEQALRGESRVIGIDHYINLGLATFAEMDFRQVFETAREIEILAGAKKDESLEERLERRKKAENAAFSAARRCFRGTGVLPNCKDLIYFNGSQQVWKFIEEHIDDYDLLETLFLSGKTDFLDERQRRIVYALKVGDFASAK